MKKKIEPKPTKISRHHAPYVFQQKSVNLHPLSGGSAQHVTQYQPNTYIMGHVSRIPDGGQSVVSQQTERTRTPHGGIYVTANESFSYGSDFESSHRSGSFDSFGGGLSTDGMEIYDTTKAAAAPPAPARPEPQPSLDELQAVNNNRPKIVKSAPASFPGDGRRMSISDFAKSVQEMEKPKHLQNLDEDADLQWLMASSTVPNLQTVATNKSPARAKSAHPALASSNSPQRMRTATGTRPRTSSAVDPSRSQVNPSVAVNGVDVAHERLVLGWIDRDLIDHMEEVEEEDLAGNDTPPPDATTGTAAGESSKKEGSFDHDDESSEEENFWSSSTRTGFSSKRHVVALTRGSLLALIEDHKHDTSKKHTKEASVDFFSAAAAAAQAVGLEDMADNLLHTRSHDSANVEDEADEVLSVSSQGSRPHSPDDAAAAAGGRARSADQVGTPANWFGAFAEHSTAVFEQQSAKIQSAKIPRSKSMEPRIPERRSNSPKASISAAANVGVSTKSKPTVTIEDFMDGIVDISESDNGVPFRMASPKRRKSLGGGELPFGNETGVSAKNVDKSGKITYFSYLYKRKKRRNKAAGASAKSNAGDANAESTKNVERLDPFEAGRSERRSSAQNLLSLLTNSASLDEELKPRPTVDLERKYSAPANDGPIWGHIPNYIYKPDSGPRSNSRNGTPSSPQAQARGRSASPAPPDGPVIRGWVKKFSFQGEFVNSPFLYHMTKEKHLEKYGDAQRRKRLAATSSMPSLKEASRTSSISPTPKPRPATVTPLKLTAVNEPKLPAFDTSIEPPKNPFNRQNSWARDTEGPDYSANTSQKPRKPFSLTRQGTNELTGGSYSEFEGGSSSNTSARVSILVRQGTQERESSEEVFSGRPELSHQNSFEANIKAGMSLLSRQNSLSGGGRPSVLARQGTQDRDGRPGVLTRQNTLDGRPALSRQGTERDGRPAAGQPLTAQLSGVAKGLSDLQALIMSINSVLVAPTPLKHSRPADVFSRGLSMGGFDTSSPLSSTKQALDNDDVDSPPPMSRGSSFKNASRMSSTPRTARSNNSSTLRAGESLLSIDEGVSRPTTSGRPGTNSVTFAPTTPGTPLLSDTMLKYVPSERRGSLSSADTLGALPVFDGISAALQRRKSMAATTEHGPAGGNIDMLVSARRNSFLGIPEGLPSPVVEVSNERQNSFDSAVNNPLMDEYYDAEEGLQDTGVIIANLHADPLYRILCEEVERSELAQQNVRRARSPSPGSGQQPGMVQGQLRPMSGRPQSSRPPRSTRSANGLSNYKNRDLGTHISPTDLKVLGTFISLPPAAWVTCRVVYFLLMSFYECVPRVSRHFEYRCYLAAEPLWEALEAQIAERNLCMEEVELQYSWPLMQSLVTRFPVLTSKILEVIECGLPESNGDDGNVKTPCFAPNIFFDAFPPTKLIYLRDLIKQGMGLFQASELMLVVPVCAQMCDWAKRVIAQVYASCISRLRASQSNTKKVMSVLHSTVPIYIPSEDTDHDLPVWEQKEKTDQVVLPPSFRFVMAVEDALEQDALVGLHSIDSYTALENGQGLPLTISHTVEKGLNLVKPNDHLDIVLVPPTLSELSMHLSSTTSLQFDDFGSQTNSLDPDPLLKVQAEWMLTKLTYEHHLKHYAASPLHRVVLVPPAAQPAWGDQQSTEPGEEEAELQRKMEEFISAQQGRPRGRNQLDSARKRMQAEGVHPVLQHCLTAAGIPTRFYGSSGAGGANKKPEADVLIARLKDGRLPALLPHKASKDEEQQRQVRFSLVLVDDQAPMIRRPLSPFSASVLAMQEKMLNTVEQAVATTVGPNRFVITIADTPHSWLAFQMVCRIAKPSDSITLVHIPVIYPPFGGKVGVGSSEGGRHTSEKNAYFTLKEYEHQRERCARRIEHLLSVYKGAGYNLFVDKIPTFQEELHRQLVYIQRKNYFHAQLVQHQLDTRLKLAAETPPPKLPFAAPKKGSSKGRLLLPTASQRAVPINASSAATADLALETNIAVRIFVQNQHTYHLATRVVAIAKKLEASFLVLGVASEDVVKAITAPPPLQFDRPSATKNLNFPFEEAVLDNCRPQDVLDSLMSARKAYKNGRTPPDPALWLECFQRYADQKIDLAEMVLHQYQAQLHRHDGEQGHHGRHHDAHGHDHLHQNHRFSFMLSNCDSLK